MLYTPTIDRCLAWKHNHNKLQALVGILQIPKHWLHLIWPCGIFTEARLSHDWHPCIIRDLLQLLGEVSEGQNK